MKKGWVLLTVILIAAGWWLVFKSKNPAPPVPATMGNTPAPAGRNNSPPPNTTNEVAAANPPAVSTTIIAPETSAIVTSAAPAPPSTPQISSLPPLTVLDNARVVMHNYAAKFGENPVGDNAEITAALMGKNPRQINFVSEESGLRVNDKGEMIDAWGTPFFFHQLSGQVMEIRSAGEDRKMWTFDDLVTR